MQLALVRGGAEEVERGEYETFARRTMGSARLLARLVAGQTAGGFEDDIAGFYYTLANSPRRVASKLRGDVQPGEVSERLFDPPEKYEPV